MQRFTCDITTNPVTPTVVMNNLLKSSPGKMLWKIDGEAVENTNDYEKVNTFFCTISHDFENYIEEYESPY